MRWITRERPKIDRLACPWLIRRFVDKRAEIIYVPFDQVTERSKELNAIPFDLPNVEYTHDGDNCTFDYIIKKHKLSDPALVIMAAIVRGADTDRHEFASQASGLWAISAGVAHNIRDDQELLEFGMVMYDGLYSWAKHLQDVKHTQNPIESLFLQVHKKVLNGKQGKRVPQWAQEIREIIQDQIDTNLAMSLKEISRSLKVHPTYLSREFSKYFDDLSFGEYIRKLRIDKAISMMKDTGYSLTEIAYLTGFSDPSHFNRIFKLHIGRTPAAYRKSIKKQ
jgi:AraC-like DNA-binding protein